VALGIIGTGLDGTILLWNEGARRLYGYEPEEVVNKARATILYTPEGMALGKDREIMDIALHHGKWEGTLQRIQKNGAQFTARVVLTPRFDALGKAVGFLFISKDISDEIRALRAEEKFRGLLESAPDAISPLRGHWTGPVPESETGRTARRAHHTSERTRHGQHVHPGVDGFLTYGR
jgi:PAS domain S-box-containing protein